MLTATAVEKQTRDLIRGFFLSALESGGERSQAGLISMPFFTAGRAPTRSSQRATLG